MEKDQSFCLKWNNYQANMTAFLPQLREDEAFVDVTLACEGSQQLKAHKLVLSACSPYFQSLLLNNPCKHPIIIMPRDVRFKDLQHVIEFVYKGEIDVAQEQLDDLLQTADQLQIKGLCEVSAERAAGGSGSGSGEQSAAVTTPSSSAERRLSEIRPSPHKFLRRPAGGATGVPPLSIRHGAESRRKIHISGPPRRRSASQSMPSPPEGLYRGLSVGGGGGESLSELRADAPFYAAPASPPAGQRSRHESSSSAAAGLTISGPLSQLSQLSQPPPHPPTPLSVHSQHTGDVDEQEAPLDLASSAPLLCEPSLSISASREDSVVRLSGGGEQDRAAAAAAAAAAALSVSAELEQLHHSMALASLPAPAQAYEVALAAAVAAATSQSSHMFQHTTHSPVSAVSSGDGDRKLWSEENMEKALEELRTERMTLSRASSVYGIPSTTLWQRAHKAGIGTPKKEGANKQWTEKDLQLALEALRAGRISANKASKQYGIPNSTLYKIAKKEGIKLSAPFSNAQTSWTQSDLEKALDAIRGGMSVMKAGTEYGIPSGTLYGRCRRAGIERKTAGQPWSEEDMHDALEVVQRGEMSINQASMYYNLPYSSLYGRIKRGNLEHDEDTQSSQQAAQQQMDVGGMSVPPPPPPSAGAAASIGY